MKISKFQSKRKLKDYDRTRRLYKEGLPLRDIGKVVGKSRQWVYMIVKGKGIKEVEKLNLPDLTLGND